VNGFGRSLNPFFRKESVCGKKPFLLLAHAKLIAGIQLSYSFPFASVNSVQFTVPYAFVSV
jgi:hypothetical protein